MISWNECLNELNFSFRLFLNTTQSGARSIKGSTLTNVANLRKLETQKMNIRSLHFRHLRIDLSTNE